VDNEVPSGFGVEDKTAVDPHVLSDTYIETSWGWQMAGIVQPAEGMRVILRMISPRAIAGQGIPCC
jgi:hypothetical protein